ncbi:MAG: hypothetical protein R3E32_17110 [Chitinophagales bacterium]
MLQFGYITLTIIMVVIILLGYNHTLKSINTPTDVRKKYLGRTWIGLFLWIAYAFAVAKSSIIQTFEFPPRFPLFLILPAFVFIGFFLRRYRNSAVIAAIPKSWLIYYQTFRIGIESLFLTTVAAGMLHSEVTFEGYNYDMVFAATAPFVAYLVFHKRLFSEKFALAWNYLGLAVIASIIFLFTTTIYFPSIWGSTESLAPMDVVTFPFVLVPAFLMPSAVFMHIVSIIQLSRKDIV